jgi:hypothetical protein
MKSPSSLARIIAYSAIPWLCRGLVSRTVTTGKSNAVQTTDPKEARRARLAPIPKPQGYVDRDGADGQGISPVSEGRYYEHAAALDC